MMTQTIRHTYILLFVLSGCWFGLVKRAEGQTAPSPIPAGAQALGYTKCVIDERPSATDIAPGKNGDYKWFSGQWYMQKPPSTNHYSMIDGMLAMQAGGDLVSAPRDFSQGKLPLLSGADGFYVEFHVRISHNDPVCFPAVWLMPVEHNRNKDDHDPDDPDGFERFVEIDVMEKMAYKGPGLVGTVHNWTGIHPKYKNCENKNNVSSRPLDFSEPHIFGASYDPRSQTLVWWVDNSAEITATAPIVPEVASKQHFYLIMSAQSHKNLPKKEYTLFVSRVRAYVPPSSSISAVSPQSP